jgi:replication factor C small subunit
MPKEFEIWAEKYRPKTFDEIINQENAVERVRVFAKSKNIPHMLFAGPPGTGKCVEKGSLIFTLEGLKNVEEINEGEKVLSLDPDGKLNFRKVKGVTEREDKIYWVKTRSGSRIGVTIEHPFLALENGLPTWKSVKELKEGDFIASIREFNLENEKALDFSRVENLFVKVEREIMVEVEKLFDGKKREIIKILTNSPLSFDEICERGNIKRGTAREMLRQLKKEGVIEKSDKKYVLVKRKIAAKILPISATTNLQRNEIKAISVKTKNGFSVWIKPFEDDEDFYEWLGYILSEGDIDNSMIIFYNKNKALLARFARLTRKIFGLQPEIGNNYVKIKCGVTLTRILSTLFDVYVGKKKSYHIKVPTRLFSGKREKAARFIRAYFDGDGSFYDNQIEIASNSKEMLLGIKTLLLKFGIISQVYSRRLLISGLEQVKKFVKEIGSFTKKFVITVKKENTNKDVLPFAAKHVKFIMDKLGLTYKDLVKNKKELEYLFERGRGSYKKVKRIYKILLKESRKKIIELLKTLDELELIASLDKTQLEKDIKEIFYMLLDIKLRKELEKLVRIRYDRLLEYSQGKRKPSIFSFLKIVEVLMHLRKIDEETYSRIRRISFVLDVLKSAFRVMNVSYNSVCSYEIHPATLAFDLREKVTSIKSAISLISIAKRLKEKMISIISNEELITTLELLDFLVNTEIFWDRIKNIEEKGYGKVYDLEIEGSHNFVGGNGLILHNTTLALVLARELYGNQWGQNVLQLNASVSKDTPILVRVDGKIKRTTFEELDSIYFKNEKEVYKNAENLEVLTVDNNLKVKWVKVSKIIRHKAEKILKVKLEGGGEIKLTGNHSVMVLDENGLKSKAASELREGEYLISFISKIKTDSTIPTNNFKASNLFYAFGLFTAEGCVGFRNNTSGQVVYTFGIHETNLVHEIKNFANELGINVYENLAGSGFNRNRLSAIHLKPLNTQLERFMKDNFYDGIAFSAENKRVPTFVFGSSIKERVDYLKGLADGDGSGKLGNVVRISSVSKDLLIDTVWLARISGIEASIFKGEARLIWKGPIKWKKGDLLPADLMIKLITKIEKRIKGNWRYKLRHQLYDKRKRVSKRIVKEILQMVERDLLKEEEKEVFKLLEKFIFSDLHVLKIKKIEIIDYDDFVYDVSVPNNEMFFAGNIPILLHNSDERGIDVIRGQVKEFARTVAIGDVPFRLIIMDEADAMTSDAQQALRRMMEMYASVSRFILIANYSSKIIEPIQSRCAVFRFKALDDKHVEEFVNRIVEGEKLKISEDGIKAVVRIAEGDLRKAANILQAASALKEKITEDVVYEAASLAKPQEVKEMLELALKGKFIEAKKMLEEMIIKKGLAGSDIVAEIHRQIPTLSIDDRAKVELIEKCGEVDFRISEGANELIQLESLLASFLLYAQFKGKK